MNFHFMALKIIIQSYWKVHVSLVEVFFQGLYKICLKFLQCLFKAV